MCVRDLVRGGGVGLWLGLCNTFGKWKKHHSANPAAIQVFRITVLTYGVNRDLIPKVTNANNDYESLDYMKKKYYQMQFYLQGIKQKAQVEEC